MEDLESHSLRYIGEVKGILTRMEKDLPPKMREIVAVLVKARNCLLYTSPSPRD